ncbi:helix-turn-helix transcriptional regulator [Comamonas sp. CMM01]|uniref:helix-turn-helix domain-containing protein n=1 Tax=Comamonas sp. CMM01 TaxID=2769280 RepID=UPI00177AC216|nr:helix-turn-helix transcriptional regulator [Comamonas sp. CMM01]MBD9531351.1 helix-turn-helix transcriptional regulator [Comamonas sp. CMM01]
MTATATPFSADSPRPAIDYAGLGDRLRAYRIGAGLQADDVAAQLGVSRAVVYRMEKGEIVKIDTLERLAALLGTSMASLLGVETEYYASALALFERMRQLEEKSDRILAHFEPISLLLTSDAYLGHLGQMLYEGLPATLLADEATLRRREIARMLEVLQERRRDFALRKPQIVSLVGLRELERFVLTGLVGRVDLPAAVRAQRVQAACDEVLRMADLMDSEPWQVQVGLVDDAMPSATYQLLRGPQHHVLLHSPFRLGELPNVRNGIAMVTTSPEAVRLHENMTQTLWNAACKGREGARRLRALVVRMATALPSPPATAYPDTP